MLTFQPKASPFAPRNLEIKLFQGGRRCHSFPTRRSSDLPADKGVVGKVCGRLDIAKSVFLVHGVDAAGHEVLRQKLSRSRVLEFFANLPRCLVGIEACASSHYWACELITQGHEVKLMPAQYVKPYVKRGKNDAADAEAICEAVTRPTMRVVGVKTVEQQSTMTLHRVRLI